MMKNVKKAILGLGVVVALSACGANPANQIQPTNPSQPQNNVLQFRVGTANLFGAATGLNVVETFRQPSSGYNPGDSAALVSSPSIYISGTKLPAPGGAVPYDALSTAWSGPAPGESQLITSTSQVPGAKNVTTFGQSGGAFGIGIEPYNYYGPYNAPAPNLVNTPFQVAPYPVPLYNPIPPPTPAPVAPATAAPPTPTPARIANAFEPWGGPPAFDLLGNGTSPVGAPNVPAGTAGIGMGLDIFNVTPKSGSYRLSVLEASNVGNITLKKSANLNAGIGLPNAVAPLLAENGNGGGTFALALPAGSTEGYIQVTDFGPPGATGCNGAHGGGPIFYTIFARSNGSYTLPNAAGPGGSPTLCTSAANTASNGGTATDGDQYLVQVIAFDYPMYEASYPNSLHDPSPNINGARGQDDVSISPNECQTYSQASIACAAPLAGQPYVRGPVVHHKRTSGHFFK